MSNHTHPHLPRRGFNLIEAAIVLAVVGLVIGGIWVAASAVSERLKWQQTEEGWLYYINYINRTYTASLMGSSVSADIDQTLASTIPLPAGWSTTASPATLRPVDPYGQVLHIQVQGTSGTYSIGYFYAPAPTPTSLCMKLMNLFYLRIFDKLATPSFTNFPAGSSNGACAIGVSNRSLYAGDALLYSGNCCPNDNIGFFAELK